MLGVQSPKVLPLLALAALSGVPGRALRTIARLNSAVAPVVLTQAPQPDPSKQRRGKREAGTKKAAKAMATAAPQNAYDYSLPGADGKDVPLAKFKGRYILVVNLGRKSSYNDQLPALLKLNDTYKDRGLVVIGVPSNDFGAAEPGSESDIQKAYAASKADFPIMSVSKITGDEELPLYGFLTNSKGAPAGGPVHWNYTKFIVDKKGDVIARLSPDVAPDSPEMLSTIDQILDGRYKPKKGADKTAVAASGSPEDDGDDDN